MLTDAGVPGPPSLSKRLLDIPKEDQRVTTPGTPTSGRRHASRGIEVHEPELLSAFSVRHLDRLSRRAHIISFWANICLFSAKLFVYLECKSMAVLAALVDSTIDLLAQGVLMWANRVSQRRTHVAYPAGRSRLEPIGVVTCAVLMAMAAVQVIRDALAELWSAYNNGSARLLDLKWLDLVLMVATILIKFALFVWCKAVHDQTANVTVEAAAQDNLNDVLSNSVALFAALCTQIKPSFWICDPLGALLISVYIIASWVQTGIEQAEMIIGRAAHAEFLDVVREMAETHDPNVSLDVVRAYHFGPKFLVELEIVMPEDTMLRYWLVGPLPAGSAVPSTDEVALVDAGSRTTRASACNTRLSPSTKWSAVLCTSTTSSGM